MMAAQGIVVNKIEEDIDKEATARITYPSQTYGSMALPNTFLLLSSTWQQRTCDPRRTIAASARRNRCNRISPLRLISQNVRQKVREARALGQSKGLKQQLDVPGFQVPVHIIGMNYTSTA